MNVEQLTRELINIESITGNEKQVALFLQDYLRSQHFEKVQLRKVDGDRFNLFAWQGAPQVVLSSHLDTVPPFFPCSEDDEYIYGRGACDAKGIIASQIKAAENLLAEGITGIGLLYVAGEESGSDGAKAARQYQTTSRFLVNGEPTDNKLAIGCKGALRLRIRVSGKAAHSAYPHLGESAIEKLIDILAELRRLSLPAHPVLGETTYNVGVISGGRQANIIPDEASAEIMFRTVSESAEIRDMLERLFGARSQFEYLFDVGPLLLHPLEGFDTTVVAFTTDIPLLSNWGDPLLIGPGSVTDAHTDHERISRRELAEAVVIYSNIVKILLKSTETHSIREASH